MGWLEGGDGHVVRIKWIDGHGGNGEIPVRADSELSGLGKQAEVTNESGCR